MILEKYSLIRIITHDIFRHGVIQLILMMMIVISSISIVSVSYRTRLMTVQKNLMIEEKESLDIEWHHLILEENLLGNHSRIEHFSIEKLQMIHIDSMQEHIVVIK